MTDKELDAEISEILQVVSPRLSSASESQFDSLLQHLDALLMEQQRRARSAEQKGQP